ncbi:hypothetical protein [Pseudoalteromonas luteoviolacea]|uniref:hypothetical protein n=1 Tax=Pseudoalteromonas luteoviolacea TaxID=43657 RepID=UPI00115195CF|nr:hypothetical protein [Pseudoalteromonas luteoviolacea]TQF71302.1 hypothetical protein FLM44_09470 [Pseudoalteromonas luteoviolacea]
MHFLNPMLQNHPMESSFIQTWLNRLADKYTPDLFTLQARLDPMHKSDMHVDIYDARHGSVIYTEFADTVKTAEAIAVKNGRILSFGHFQKVYQTAKHTDCIVRIQQLQPAQSMIPSCVHAHCYLIESALCRHYADLGLYGLSGVATRASQDYGDDYVVNALAYLDSSLAKGDCLFCFGLDPYLLNWGKPIEQLYVSALDELGLNRPLCIISSDFASAYVNSKLIERIQESALGKSPSIKSFIDGVSQHGFVTAEGMSILPWAFSDTELIWQLSELDASLGIIVEQGAKQGICHFEAAVQSQFVALLFESLASFKNESCTFSTYPTYQCHIDELARLDHCEVLKSAQLNRLSGKTSVGLTVGRLATSGFKWVNDYHYDELLVPARSILQSGCNLCLQSNFPSEPLSPLRLAEIASERDIEVMPAHYSCEQRTLDPSERVTLVQALNAVTHGAARHIELTGFNEIDSRANFSIINCDPLCSSTRLIDAKLQRI